MILKVNQLSAADIKGLIGIEVSSISIENCITAAKLEQVARLIKENDAIKLVLVVDPAIERKEEDIYNLDILQEIPHLRQLSILAFGSSRLENLDGVQYLENLISFSLQGFYKKDIDLGSIQKHEALERLELEFGISGKKQLEIVNSFTNLKELRVSTIDLSEMRLNRHLTALKANNTIRCTELFPLVFPGLNSLEIHFAKAIASFDFLSKILLLENLTIGDTKKLVGLPVLENANMIQKLTLSNVGSFNDWQSILQLENLAELNILGPTQISKEDVLQFEVLPHLKRVKVSFLGINSLSEKK